MLTQPNVDFFASMFTKMETIVNIYIIILLSLELTNIQLDGASYVQAG